MTHRTYTTLCLDNDPAEVKATAYETHDTLHVTVGDLTVTGTATSLLRLAADLYLEVGRAMRAKDERKAQAA